MERVWEDAYQQHRNEWKSQAVRNTNFNNNSSENTAESESASFNNLDVSIVASFNVDCRTESDMSNFGNLTNDFSGLQGPFVSVEQSTVFSDEVVNKDVDPYAIANTWSLNAKQMIAYRLIVERCMHNETEPLSMIITGAAGTGKSRIIHAAQNFLVKRNEAYRFQLSSFTGIAAQNIKGVNLHSALSLSAIKGSNLSSTTRENLVKMWISYLLMSTP